MRDDTVVSTTLDTEPPPPRINYMYDYKKLPVQYKSDISNDDRYLSSYGFVLLRPFKVDKTYYIATFFNTNGRGPDDGHGGSYISKEINDNDFVAISKYDAKNEQHDMCYLIRTFTSPTYKKTNKTKKSH